MREKQNFMKRGEKNNLKIDKKIIFLILFLGMLMINVYFVEALRGYATGIDNTGKKYCLRANTNFQFELIREYSGCEDFGCQTVTLTSDDDGNTFSGTDCDNYDLTLKRFSALCGWYGCTPIYKAPFCPNEVPCDKKGYFEMAYCGTYCANGGTCNTATHTCSQPSPPPSLCGNGIKDNGENCGTCWQDSPCPENGGDQNKKWCNENNQCVPEPPVCGNNPCVCVECDSTHLCPTNYICNNGKCKPECENSDDCGSGKYCQDGKCINAVTVCLQHQTIVENQCICEATRYLEAGQCKCPSGNEDNTGTTIKCIPVEGTCACDDVTQVMDEDGNCKCIDEKAQLVKDSNGKLICQCINGYTMNYASGVCECSDSNKILEGGKCFCRNGLDTPDCQPKEFPVYCTCGNGNSCPCKKKTKTETCVNDRTSSCGLDLNSIFASNPNEDLSTISSPNGNLFGSNAPEKAECGIRKDGCGKYWDCDNCDEQKEYKCKDDGNGNYFVMVEEHYCRSDGKKTETEYVNERCAPCYKCTNPIFGNDLYQSQEISCEPDSGAECKYIASGDATCCKSCGTCEMVSGISKCVKGGSACCKDKFVCLAVPEKINNEYFSSSQRTSVKFIANYNSSTHKCEYTTDDNPLSEDNLCGECWTCDKKDTCGLDDNSCGDDANVQSLPTDPCNPGTWEITNEDDKNKIRCYPGGEESQCPFKNAMSHESLPPTGEEGLSSSVDRDSDKEKMMQDDEDIFGNCGYDSSVAALKPNSFGFLNDFFSKLFKNFKGEMIAGVSAVATSSDKILYLDFNNNINDQSGRGHVITYTDGSGGSPSYVAGKRGSTILLGENKRIKVDDSHDLKAENDLTISMWIKTNSVEVGYLLDKGEGGTAGEYSLYYFNSGRVGLVFKTSSGVNTGCSIPNTINDNQWHMITGVLRSNAIEIYLDGDLKCTDPNRPTLYIGNSPIIIGGLLNSKTFIGSLDEIKIWNRALSSTEISDEFNSINCVPETNTQFCTRLGKCGTVTANDNCGTSRTVDCGTCTNPANGTGSCNNNICQNTCNLNYLNCNSNWADGCEVYNQIDSSNCGTCGHVCSGATTACSKGKCIPCSNTCVGGNKKCNGNSIQTCGDYNGDGCVEWGGDANCPYGCSGGICNPCVPETNETFCIRLGKCGIVSAMDNCGINLRMNVDCGVCSKPNSAASCTSNVCGTYSCNQGYADCNGDLNNAISDGCETNLNTDDDNCATCGNRCLGLTSVCNAGVCCAPQCAGKCGGAPDGCGKQCFHACPAGERCNDVTQLCEALSKLDYFSSNNPIGISGNSAFTISFWTIPSSNPNGKTILGFGNDDLAIDYNSNTKTFVSKIGSSYFSASGIYPENAMHHVVETYNKTDFKIYVDNNLALTKNLLGYNFPDGKLYATANPLLSKFYNGTIKDLKILNYEWNGIDVGNEFSREMLGLALYYPFDNDFNDASANYYSTKNGNGNLESGKFGNALNSKSSNIVIEDSYGLESFNGITVSAWVNTVASDTIIESIIRKGTENGALKNQEYMLYIINGNIYFSLGNGANYDSIGGTRIKDGKWHWVMGILKTNNEMQLYIDGKLDKSKIRAYTGTPENANLAIIGSITRNANFFNGLIDEVKVWDYGLNNEEIAMENASYYSSKGNLLLDYSFDEESLKDYSGNNKTGIWIRPGNIKDNLALYYPFNGNMNDNSGNANSGVNAGAQLTQDRFARPASAYYFDGSSSKIIPSASDLLNFSGGKMSISFWLNVANTETDSGYIISKPWNSAGNYNYWIKFISPGTLEFMLGGNQQKFIRTAFPKAQWHFITATMDSSTMSLYIDGVLNNSINHEIINWTSAKGNSNIPLTIGAVSPLVGAGSSTDYFLKGNIDELKIWKYALTSDEVSDEYKKQNLTLYYPFNGNMNDSSGNNNNGANNGAQLTKDKNGNPGSAYYFDEKSRINSSVNDPNLKFTGGRMSISLWAYAAGDENQGYIISKPWNGNQYNYWLRFFGTNQLELRLGGATDNYIYATLTKSQWHFITATMNSTTMSLYVDGLLSKNITHKITSWVPSGGDNNAGLVIGAISSLVGTSNPDYFLKGNIDEVKIWRKDLNADEVLQEYQNKPFKLNDFGNGKVFSGEKLDSTFYISSSLTSTPASPLTASFWVKPSSDNKMKNDSLNQMRNLGRSIFSIGNFANNAGIFVFYNSDKKTFEYGYTGNYASLSGDYFPESWYHVVVEFNKTDELIFINGKLRNFLKITNPNFAGGQLTIGSDSFGHERLFNGMIDEFKIWNYSLSNNEIYSEYNNGRESYSLYYPFNGDTFDYSGLGNDGFNLTAITFDAGIKGQSVLFSNSNVIINNSYGIYLDKEITVSAWVKTSSSTGLQGILRRGDLGGAFKTQEYMIYALNGKSYFLLGNGNNYDSIEGVNIADNKWHMITGVLRNNNQMEIYDNGKLISSKTKTITGVPNSNFGVVGSIGANSEFFNGNIDEVKIWDYGLNDEEIKKEYESTLKSVKVYYPFTDDLLDYSGNANDGNLIALAGIPSYSPGSIFSNIFEGFKKFLGAKV